MSADKKRNGKRDAAQVAKPDGSDKLSRRAFVGLGASALAGAAAGGLAGCAPKEPEAAGTSSTTSSGSGSNSYDYVNYPAYGPDVAGTHPWEIAPEPIADDKIGETIDCDVLVIGAGLGGCSAALAAREKGGQGHRHRQEPRWNSRGPRRAHCGLPHQGAAEARGSGSG